MEHFDPKKYKSHDDLPDGKKIEFKQVGVFGEFVRKDAIMDENIAEIFARAEEKNSQDGIKGEILQILKNDKSRSYILRSIPEPFKSDKDIVLAALQTHGSNLEYAPQELRDDRDVVLEAIKKYPQAYEHASERLREDPELTALALANGPSHLLYEFVPPKFQIPGAKGSGDRWKKSNSN